jgi:hypothetical protein
LNIHASKGVPVNRYHILTFLISAAALAQSGLQNDSPIDGFSDGQFPHGQSFEDDKSVSDFSGNGTTSTFKNHDLQEESQPPQSEYSIDEAMEDDELDSN